MREFLITKFVCSKCGSNLKLTYELPKGSSQHTDGEPTGAAMVEQRIAIEPCQCVQRPLNDVRHAVKALLDA